MKNFNVKLILVIIFLVTTVTESKEKLGTKFTYDVGVKSIDMDIIVPQSIMFPLATVKNYGSQLCSFEVKLKIGEEIERTYIVTDLEPENAIQIQFDDVNLDINIYQLTCSTKLLNGLQDEDTTNDVIGQKLVVLDYSIIRGFCNSNILANKGGFYSYCFSPEIVNLYGVGLWEDFFCGSAVGSDEQLYSIPYGSNEYFANKFYRWSYSSAGAQTTVVTTVMPTSGTHWSGLTYDSNLNKFVASSNNASDSYLYTISQDSYDVFMLCVFSGTNIQAVASKGDGFIYCIDTKTDVLLKVSLADYNKTVIGNLGFNAEGSQSIEFERNTGVLFYAAHHADGTAEMRLLDINDASSIVLTQYKNKWLDGIAIQNVSVLPVELTAFVCVKITDKVLLNWQTATEKNNSCFEIERRTVENSEWVKIGTVEGSGTTTEIHNYSFLDNTVYSNEVFYYRLKQVDYDGSFSYSKVIKTGNIESPNSFVVNQNYPNPFNPQTSISYSLPIDGNVKLTIVNLLGEELVTLVDETQKPGNYEKVFDGSNLASGIYFYRLVVKGNSGEVFTNTKKMLLLK